VDQLTQASGKGLGQVDQALDAAHGIANVWPLVVNNPTAGIAALVLVVLIGISVFSYNDYRHSNRHHYDSYFHYLGGYVGLTNPKAIDETAPLVEEPTAVDTTPISSVSPAQVPSPDVSMQANKGLGILESTADEKDYDKAIELCSSAAEKGDADGQYCMAKIHDDGLGVAKNPTAAVKWLRLAVAQDHTAAQNYLGMMYLKGQGGLPQNEYEAVRLVQLAANKGHAKAQNNLGVFFEKGIGSLDLDLGEAFVWWQKSARQGHPTAQRNLRRYGISW